MFNVRAAYSNSCIMIMEFDGSVQVISYNLAMLRMWLVNTTPQIACALPAWIVFVSLKLGVRLVSPLGWEHSHYWFIFYSPNKTSALYVSEEVVPQLFNEGFPSCGPLGCWSWDSWHTGDVLCYTFTPQFHTCIVAVMVSGHFLLVFTWYGLVHLFQCGFKMFTRAAARKLFTNIRLKR